MPHAGTRPAGLQEALGPTKKPAPAPGRRATLSVARASRFLFAAVCLLTLATTAAPTKATAAPSTPTDGSLTYKLAETWTDLPRPTSAGHFLDPLDITSLPDGTVAVLGEAYGAGGSGPGVGAAIHVLTEDGSPLRLLRLGATYQEPLRIDGGFDGRLEVLGQLVADAGAQWVVQRLDPDGALARQVDLEADALPIDVAAAPNGDVLVTMGTVPSRIDVHDSAGTLVDQIVPDRMAIGGPSDPFRYSLTRLDVGPDGTIYAMAVARRDCPPGPPARPTRPPTPTPTPRPSVADSEVTASGFLAGEPDGNPAPDQINLPCSKTIVLVFEPDHSFREEVPNDHTTDIAAGSPGVFVSTSRPGFRRPAQKVYELYEQIPVLQYRVPDPLDIPIPYSAPELQLDVAFDGRVQVSGSGGAPFYRGAAALGDPTTGRPPSALEALPLGITDDPALSGPNCPRRLDAASEVVLLEGPYQRYGPGLTANTGTDVSHDASAIQRWSLSGYPVWQAMHREKLLREGAEGADQYNILAPLVDVAYDGADLYALSGQILWQRSDALPPRWYRHVPGAHFVAVAADEGRAAALNAAGRRILVVDRAGRFLYDKPIAWDWSKRLASDLALDGDQVYLADQGRNVVMVRGIDGADLGEWPTQDGPLRVSVGPEGDVFVLGRGGYAMRYSPDGKLKTAWRLPVEHQGIVVDGYDLGVGDDGRVYVNFMGLSDPDPDAQPPGNGQGYDIDAAGVWVFAPVTVEDPQLPDPSKRACLATPHKSAAPSVILLGEEVDVTLDVEGYCPGHHAPQQLIIVLDTSYSMHDTYYTDYPGPGALRRAQQILTSLLQSIDPETIEIGLITFSGGAGMEVPLPGDLGLVRSRIVTRRADGDTQLATGIELARAELSGPRGRPDVKQTILVVSDGLFKDDPLPAVRSAQAAGIEVAALVLSTPGFDADARAAVEELIGDSSLVFIDPIPETARRIIEEVSAYVPNPGLFQSVTITDVLPSNMTYVPGSADPAAEYDAGTRSLVWSMDSVTAAEGLRLSFTVEPQETGLWPTNSSARGAYRDAWDNDGTLAFPVPSVLVLAPDIIVTPTPIPPTPTATATRAPTRTIYLPFTSRPPVCVRKVVHADVVLALDMSTSMYRETSAGRTKHEAAIAAARMFISLLDLEPDEEGKHDQVAVVGFNDRAWTAVGLTSERSELDAALDALLADIREGTRLDLVFERAQRELESPLRRADNQPALILLTDGLPNRVPTPDPSGGQEDTVLAAAQRAKDAGTIVYTIGLGQPDDLWPSLLREAATSPSMYYYAPDGEDLIDIYRRILIRLVCDQ